MKNLITKDEEKPTAEKESNIVTPSKWLINWITGGETESGETVSEETAMKMASVYACIRLLSQSVAKLPLHTYTTKSGKKERENKHPVAYLLEFKETMEMHRQLYGNAYAEIQFGRDGYPKGLWILNPALTEIVTDDKNHRKSLVHNSSSRWTSSKIKI